MHLSHGYKQVSLRYSIYLFTESSRTSAHLGELIVPVSGIPNTVISCEKCKVDHWTISFTVGGLSHPLFADVITFCMRWHDGWEQSVRGQTVQCSRGLRGPDSTGCVLSLMCGNKQKRLTNRHCSMNPVKPTVWWRKWFCAQKLCASSPCFWRWFSLELTEQQRRSTPLLEPQSS